MLHPSNSSQEFPAPHLRIQFGDARILVFALFEFIVAAVATVQVAINVLHPQHFLVRWGFYQHHRRVSSHCALTVLTRMPRRAVLRLLPIFMVRLLIQEINEGYWIAKHVLIVGLDNLHRKYL